MRDRTLELITETGLDASLTGDTFACGLAKRIVVVCSVANASTDAEDTLDNYIDMSIDGSVWYNVIHFTQTVGTDADIVETAILDASNPGTDVVDITTECVAGKVRPASAGNFIRARAVVVADEDDQEDQSFDVTIAAFLQE